MKGAGEGEEGRGRSGKVERRREERGGKVGGGGGRVQRAERKERGQEVHEEGEVKAEQILSERRTRINQPTATTSEDTIRTYIKTHTHLVLCTDVFVFWTVGILS